MNDADIQQLVDAAENILKANVFEGYTTASGDIFIASENTKRKLYPFQWLWDTFFIAGWSSNIKQSISDVEKFLKGQQPNGFLGHIRYNREILVNSDYFPSPEIYYYNDGGIPTKGELVSRITQPPNVAYGIGEMLKKILDFELRQSLLKKFFPFIYRYHKYLANNLTRDGLVVVIHPWQAGDDNSPRWDYIYKNIKSELLHKRMEKWLRTIKLKYERIDLKIVDKEQRPTNSHYDIYLFLIWLYGEMEWREEVILNKSPFRVLDPLTNTLWIRSNQVLKMMAVELEQKSIIKEIDIWLDEAQQGLETLWNEKIQMYATMDLVTKKQIEIKTISGILPLFTRVIPREHAEKMAKNIILTKNKYPQRYLLPSTDFEEYKYFNSQRYWRGPVWIIINALISEGLDFYGYGNLSELIKEQSLELIYKSLSQNNLGGFYEYYDAITGQGLGSPKQSWTAAAVLKLLESGDRESIDKLLPVAI